MHILPQLRELEKGFGAELAVIGVHAGKFHAERVTANIRQAVMRLDVEHPVVNDRHFRIWRSYAINAWPTIALIDPDGRHVATRPGEVTAAFLKPVIESMIGEFDEKGKLDREPLPLRLERDREPKHPLAFPAKVLATSDRRLFVADSNHNRLLLLRLGEDGTRGNVEAVVGQGEAGLVDGSYERARFRHPHGLALVGNGLYVADMENHAIRLIDLERRQVTTVAGTGAQARQLASRGGKATEAALSSPWDLAHHHGQLFIAMAGTHQIWRLDLGRNEVHPHAGSGREDILDGPLAQAALSQPSGLASDGQRLYFADTESSGIRWADLDPGGRVGTIVGRGLFEFGDIDGTGDEVRLQHAQGLTWHDGTLYVADTYNNKIKRVGPTARTSEAFLGTGEAGHRDNSPPRFYEPGGVSAANGRLYIADTNNHRIRVADMATRAVRTLEIHGL